MDGEIHDIDKRNLETNNNYGAAWANLSSTPFRLYKHFTHEGGSATPFFIHWPSGIKPQKKWYRSQAQLLDVFPTLLEVCGVKYPESFEDRKLSPLRGISLSPSFVGEPLERSKPMFSEHENNAFMIDGKMETGGEGGLFAQRSGDRKMGALQS